jgi:hypothetical protein
MTPEFGKLLMLLAGIVFLVGAAAAFNLLPWLGRLPGDISIRHMHRGQRRVDSYSPYFSKVIRINRTTPAPACRRAGAGRQVRRGSLVTNQ